MRSRAEHLRSKSVEDAQVNEHPLTWESWEPTTSWKLCLSPFPLLSLPHIHSSVLLQVVVHPRATPLPAEGPYVLHQVALAAIVTVTWEEVAH